MKGKNELKDGPHGSVLLPRDHTTGGGNSPLLLFMCRFELGIETDSDFRRRSLIVLMIPVCQRLLLK